jgi:hypothetical protein
MYLSNGQSTVSAITGEPFQKGPGAPDMTEAPSRVEIDVNQLIPTMHGGADEPVVFYFKIF